VAETSDKHFTYYEATYFEADETSPSFVK